ncbi:MAG TPA: antibiotic biosynthesis monooxygenase [Nitrosomonas sp.]|uniref:antibiotic biosynthesis monooxygenase n=1 Tax=Nitrosomonas sp. TaxID=42353 RepID=UPI000E8750A9|nr:antibiotic biosynthesis monooxygenase [Nitrosomonas sp.]GJL76840.1 MAG: (4S)-4-hydroxy-5-phosphonooxypentane-2,3-dione isomerase [Nitrosomonas sp.]HBV20118.1 antibiotic biosynthesis monooxygenase [Nitrosomonas sp.]HNP26801.1 antibiotic biosynthesis monooxygenase [Nitrosomonas sp.]
MYVTIVTVSVKPGNVDAFKEACRLNHEGSIQEPGNMRFDILQSAEEPTKFVLYEAYKTQQDAAAHKTTEHYLAWREAVADWMAEPRQGVAHHGLYPVVDAEC